MYVHSNATRKRQRCPKENIMKKRGMRRLEDMEATPRNKRQCLEEQFLKRRGVSKATKSEYRFCPRSDAIHLPVGILHHLLIITRKIYTFYKVVISSSTVQIHSFLRICIHFSRNKSGKHFYVEINITVIN